MAGAEIVHREADAQGLEFNLNARHSVDEYEHVIAVVAVVGVDAKLVNYLKGVFAPVFDVDQGVVERCAVVAGKGVAPAQGAGGGEHVGGNDVFK